MLSQFFILIFITGTTFGGVLYERETTNGRIVGGSDAKIEDYPYQVSVNYAGFHTCGGGILNSDTVLTAGHCVYNRVYTSFFVRVGSTLKSTGGDVIIVSSVHLHEEYEHENMLNDIAILKLATNLVFSNAVQPIALPTGDFDPAAGTETILAGWGRLEYQVESPDQLQRVALPIVDRNYCADVYIEWTTIGVGEKQICAGEEGHDACQGDSGGPLVYNNAVIGLVSWGNECALAEYPTVFTRVGSHLNWINQFL